MRTGIEVPLVPIDLEQLDDSLRTVAHHLVDAMRSLPDPASIPVRDRETVQNIRWSVAEAVRLGTHYRRQLADRLAGATPGQSHHASLHDPPDACPGDSPP